MAGITGIYPENVLLTAEEMMDGRKEYTKDDICAVVVSYNPDPVLGENLDALLPQAGCCVVVDNGSTKRDVFDQIKNKSGITVIELGENKGIAYALNRGVEECRKKNCALLLTMDQDTILEPNAVEEMLKILNTKEVQSAGINWDGKATEDEEVSYLITSGNLVTMDAINAIGGYDERLFIDSVDFDFSLRLLDRGYKMIKAANAKAIHHLGEKQEGGGYTTHSVERYYYIYRNHFYLIRKYRKTHRSFCIKKQLALGLDLFGILLHDKERRAKFRMLKQGYLDSKKMTVA